MKMFRLSLWLLLALISFSLEAQFSCGTKDKSNELWMNQIGRPEMEWKNLLPRATVNIPMHYHIVSDDNGKNGYPMNYLYFIHCDLNYEFKRSGIDIQFYIDTISYIKSSKYFDVDGLPSGGTEDKEMMQKFNTLNHCNVYLVHDPSGACGYVTDFPSMGPPSNRSSLFIQASATAFQCSNPGNKTLPHEMGHWLDLRHTFFNWEGQPYPPNLTQHPKSKWENVARTGTGSNCFVNGDGFCDTDPDYISGRWDCPYTGTPFTDAAGVSFMPKAGKNFMSYSNDECSDTFSPQQRARMVKAMDSFTDRKDLKSVPYPTFPDITTFSYFYPKDAANANQRVSRKNLRLKFNALSGTTKYLVTLGKSSTTTISSTYDFLPTDLLIDTLITDTFIDVPISKLGSIINNTYFYWKVRAFNKTSACGDNVIAKQAFRVKDINLEFKSTPAKCAGDTSGTLIIADSSGLSTLQFKVDGKSTNLKTLTGQKTGVHTLEVTMADNTSVIYETFISEPKPISGTVSYPAAFSASVMATGGTSPYTYTWSNGKTGAAQSGLSAGDYSITVTDSKGCTMSTPLKATISSSGGGGGGGGVSIQSSEMDGIDIFPTKIQSGELININKHQHIIEYTVFDNNGRISFSGKLNRGEDAFLWEAKGAGIYYIKLNSGSSQKVFKVEGF